MKTLCRILALALALAFTHLAAFAAEPSVAPIPPELASLPTIVAEPWLVVEAKTTQSLEGPSFDRQGNLVATLLTWPRKLLKIDAQKQISTIYESRDIGICGTAIHKDGRIFLSGMSGELVSINSDGSNVTIMKPLYRNKMLRMNDLVFDAKGNLFVTDFVGNIEDPVGGVYYITADGKSVRPVLQHLWAANGISLTANGRTLWVSETSRNSVLRADLQADGVTPVLHQGVSYIYHSTGWNGLDSNRLDAKGNLYQTVHGQGRIIVFNPLGIPIANVVVAGKDEGKFLEVTSLAIKPETREGYITTGGEGGAAIFKFETLAPAAVLFSHQ